MTDDAIAPDPVVETALRLLPVPDHGSAFWAELSDRIAAELAPHVDEPALAVGPRLVTSRPLVADPPPNAVPSVVPEEVTAQQQLMPDPTLLLVPPSLRRRSNLVLSGVAVAAAVVVILAGSTLVQQRSGGGVATEPASATGNAAEGGAASASTVASSTAVASSAPTDVVLAWVGAMGSGDAERAWGMLGPASQAHFGTRAAFVQQRSSDATDYGAWSAAKATDALVMAVGGGDDEVLVVTLVGADTRAGANRRYAVAVPVRMVAGTARVEPFAFAGELLVVVPAASAPGAAPRVVASDDELVVVVPRGVTAPTVRLDDGAPVVCGKAAGTRLTEPAQSPGQRCSYRPANGMTPGRHVVTVAFRSSDGSGIGAESVVFRAA